MTALNVMVFNYKIHINFIINDKIRLSKVTTCQRHLLNHQTVITIYMDSSQTAAN